MNFPRGFKTRANQLALEVRDGLGLEHASPICPWSLAEFLGIPIVSLRSLKQGAPAIAGHVDYLATRGSQFFSAITVFREHRRLIVHNDSHAPTRQRSNLAHELAHALLLHPPHPPFCENGKRVYDRVLENEAAWLGPVLLVPNEAARWAATCDLPESEAARHYGVSGDLMRFRLRMSGAVRIAAYRSTR